MSSTTLVLRNHLDDLDRLSDWIVEVSEQYSFSQKLSFYLELVIAEAVTNIIQNAYLDQDEHTIPILLSCDDHRVRVEIKDDGLPFDPLQQPEVTFPTRLEEADEGGLGIHLIRSYTQECCYRRQHNQNVLTLTLSKEP